MAVTQVVKVSRALAEKTRDCAYRALSPKGFVVPVNAEVAGKTHPEYDEITDVMVGGISHRDIPEATFTVIFRVTDVEKGEKA